MDVVGAERVEPAAVGTGADARAVEGLDGEAPVGADGNVGNLGTPAAQIGRDGLRLQAVAGKADAQLGDARDRIAIGGRVGASPGHQIDLDAEDGGAASGEQERDGGGAHQWGHVVFTVAVVGVWPFT